MLFCALVNIFILHKRVNMLESTLKKISILSAAAKYDVSCSSSGSKRNTPSQGIGNGALAGICHSFTEDGRCISLLKILFSNACQYDCAYCINRKSNDIPRATFSIQELTDLVIGLYKRNYIEGLFLSSAIFKNPDYTMELLVRVAKDLREKYRFGGYIHLKAIPGASALLIHQAGLYADRCSVNIEVPSSKSLSYLAPDKNFKAIFQPMNYLAERKLEYSAGKPSKYTPHFLPAGQTTQMIIGASGESDLDILKLSSGLYQKQKLKRVYFSGYIPLNNDKRLPAITVAPPLVRENRLYQADWLMRFYQFSYDEILDDSNPHLDLQIDPKMGWALRHPEAFPLDINIADYEMILRIPGIGVRSAKMIVMGRRHGRITLAHLKKLGVALNRAKYFIYDPDLPRSLQLIYPEQIRMNLITPPKKHKNQISFLPSLAS